MINAKELLQKIESGDVSYEDKLAALGQVETALKEMRERKETILNDRVGMIVDALKTMQRKVEAKLEEVKAIVPEVGPAGPKGEPGERGLDGTSGRDGRDGVDGRNGVDGQDGVSVTDAKIDFDGSLVITLSTGREINVGEVVAPDLAEKIKVITNGGGTSQSVLDAIAALQTQIDNLIPSQTGNAGKFLTTDGTNTSWATVAGGGAVDSVNGQTGVVVLDAADVGASVPITVQDEGSTLTSAATSLNFTGAGVTATNTGGAVTVAITGGGSGISSADIQEFTSTGTSTWTKPAGAKLVYVLLFSGGGGGGSGRRRNVADTALAGGGTGGPAGGRVEAWIPAVELGSTESVVVGAGGTGGAARTVDNTNGLAGGPGEASTFSFFLAREATNGGGGGTSTGAGSGGSSGGTNTSATTFAATFYTANGGAGSSGTANPTAAPRGGMQGGGGGGGGGIAANGTTTYTPAAGGLGGAVYSSFVTSTGGGGAAGTSGVTATSGTSGAVASTDFFGGSGGGGGGSATVGTAGSGGNGGYPGGGGGGGGSSNSGFNSGAGGNGGDGYVRVVTFF